MKYSLFFLLFSLSLMTGCGGNAAAPEAKPVAQEKKPVHNPADVIPDMIAELAIRGMACEYNCVSSVQRAVLALSGVASFQMDFDPELEVNHATVRFDKDAVSEKDMVEAIEGLYEGQYKVESVAVKAIEGGEQAKKKQDKKTTSAYEGGEQAAAVYGSGGSLSMPNIFDVFSNTL